MRWTITNTDDGSVTYGEADNPEDVLTAMHDGVMLRDSGQPGKSGTFQEWKFGKGGEVVRIGPIYRVQRRRSAPTGRAMATYRVRLPQSLAAGIEEFSEATGTTMSEFLRVAAVQRLAGLGYD